MNSAINPIGAVLLGIVVTGIGILLYEQSNSLPGVVPRDAVAIFSCGNEDPVTVVVIDTENTALIYDMRDNEIAEKAFNAVKQVTAKRRYFVRIDRHCPYNKRKALQADLPRFSNQLEQFQ